tara:strand:+ start:289 stop:540 length:252 start_codon:yes stop_codon:yes gene_type:complete
MTQVMLNGELVTLSDEEEKKFLLKKEEGKKEKEERKKLRYRFNRRDSYPDIGDQLDALYHAGVFPKEMADKIKAVKDANPKPE